MPEAPLPPSRAFLPVEGMTCAACAGRVRRALLSVSDKTGLLPLAQALASAGVELAVFGEGAQAFDLPIGDAEHDHHPLGSLELHRTLRMLHLRHVADPGERSTRRHDLQVFKPGRIIADAFVTADDDRDPLLTFGDDTGPNAFHLCAQGVL